MKKESILIAVVALIVGLLGGFLVFSMSSIGKKQQPAATIPSGSGSPTDYASRIAEAEKIVARDPKNLNVWLSLGNDYYDTDQAQKSIYAYGKVLEIEPNNPSVLTDQGVMYRKLGWFDKALENFEKAQRLDPRHLQSLYNLGILYTVDLKQPEKSAPIWKRYLQMDPNSPTAMQIKSMMSSPPPTQPMTK